MVANDFTHLPHKAIRLWDKSFLHITHASYLMLVSTFNLLITESPKLERTPFYLSLSNCNGNM